MFSSWQIRKKRYLIVDVFFELNSSFLFHLASFRQRKTIVITVFLIVFIVNYCSFVFLLFFTFFDVTHHIFLICVRMYNHVCYNCGNSWMLSLLTPSLPVSANMKWKETRSVLCESFSQKSTKTRNILPNYELIYRRTGHVFCNGTVQHTNPISQGTDLKNKNKFLVKQTDDCHYVSN